MWLLNILNRVAGRFKGAGYRLDPNLPLAGLLSIGARRAVWMIRGFLAFPFRGKRIFIAPRVMLRNKSFFRYGDGSTLSHSVQIDGLSRDGVHIGRNVNIGPYTIIQASGVMSRLGTGCRIGDDSGIGGFSFIGCGGGVTIGDNVIMGQYVSFHSENHVTERTDIPIRLQGVTRSGIVIEDDCWVGAKATFLDGAHVGRGCVIAAGSVVRGEIPAFSIAAGVPAKIIRSRLPKD